MSTEVMRKLEEYDRRFERVEGDIVELKSNVKVLTGDVKTLKSDVKTLKSDVKTLKSDVHRLGILSEAQDQKIDQVLEIVQGIAEQVGSSKRSEQVLENHEHRIAALEHAYRQRG